MRKRKVHTENTSITPSVDETPYKRESYRKVFTEGRSSDVAPDFAGALPDIFLYRCKKDTEADGVKNSLTMKGLKINSVDLISHVDAATRSFKVCVESTDDFDRLMSGDCIPRYVRVKEFIHFRRKNSDKSSWGHASIVNDQSNGEATPVDLSSHNDASPVNMSICSIYHHAFQPPSATVY